MSEQVAEHVDELEIPSSEEIIRNHELAPGTAREPASLSRIVELPAWTKLLTAPGQILETRDKDRAYLAVLASAKNDDEVLVVHAPLDTPGVDVEELLDGILVRINDRKVGDIYFEERESKSLPLSVAGYYVAPREIIDQLYHQGERRNEIATGEKVELTDNETAAMDKVLNEIIAAARAVGASDIHFEQRREESNLRVRFRVHGSLERHDHFTLDVGTKLSNFIYNATDKGTTKGSFNPKRVYDARLTRKHVEGEKGAIRLRLNYSPGTVTDFDIIARLLGTAYDPVIGLNNAGYNRHQLAALNQALTSLSGGLVLMTAPPNAGKSTTLRAAVNHIINVHGENLKIISVEDPVEYHMHPIVSQREVVRPEDPSDVDGIRAAYMEQMVAAMRSDPDVLVIGELRDPPTIQFALKLIEAGNLVLSTIHAETALGGYRKLLEGSGAIEMVTSESFVRMVPTQRLVPVLCEHCSVSGEELHDFLFEAARNSSDRTQSERSSTELSHLRGLWDRLEQRRTIPREMKYRAPRELQKANLGEICPHCDGRGTVGRTVIAEFVAPDAQLNEHMRYKEYDLADLYWRGKMTNPWSGFTLQDHAIDLAINGTLDPREIEKQTDVIAAKPSRADYERKYERRLESARRRIA